MELTDINLKEQSLETLKLLMDYTNYFLLELNEQLQYYNRGMIIPHWRSFATSANLNFKNNHSVCNAAN
jgi:hypothetical protein